MSRKTDTFDNYSPPKIRKNISEYILSREEYTQTRAKDKGTKAGGWYSSINKDDEPQVKTRSFLVKDSGGYSLSDLNTDDLLKINDELNLPAAQTTLMDISQNEYLEYLYERVKEIFVKIDPKGTDIVNKMKANKILNTTEEKITVEFVNSFNQQFLTALAQSRDYMINYESLPMPKVYELSAIKELYAFEVMRLLLGKDNVPPARLMREGLDSLTLASKEIPGFQSVNLDPGTTYLNLTGQIIAALVVGESDFNFNNKGVAPFGDSGELKFYSIDHDYALNIDDKKHGFSKPMDLSAQSLSDITEIPIEFFSKDSIDRALEHIASISIDQISKLSNIFERKLDEYRDLYPVDAYRFVGTEPDTLFKHIEERHLQIKIMSIKNDLLSQNLEKFIEKIKLYQLPEIELSKLLKLAEDANQTDFVKCLRDNGAKPFSEYELARLEADASKYLYEQAKSQADDAQLNYQAELDFYHKLLKDAAELPDSNEKKWKLSDAKEAEIRLAEKKENVDRLNTKAYEAESKVKILEKKTEELQRSEAEDTNKKEKNTSLHAESPSTPTQGVTQIVSSEKPAPPSKDEQKRQSAFTPAYSMSRAKSDKIFKETYKVPEQQEKVTPHIKNKNA